MKRLRTFLKYAALFTGILIFIALVVAEWRYDALWSTPRFDRSLIVNRPVVMLLIQPDKAAPFIKALARKNSSVPIPDWLFDRFMAHEAGILISDVEKGQSISLYAYASLPRLAKPLTRELNKRKALEKYPEITWSPDKAQNSNDGLVLYSGTVPMDEETLDDVSMQWNQSIRPPALELAEGHFIEGLFDNRIGSGYLTMASLMHAFDINLDENQQNISLSSFQFVLSMRMAVDILNDNTIKFYLVIEVLPEAKQRLAVVNLKVGLDDMFEEYKKTLESEHGITMTGQSAQTENIIEYKYRIDNAVKVAELILAGEL